ncbi:hypothetical protein Tco_0833767 [Tanacetum coccineum]
MDYILEDSVDKNSPDDNLVDTLSEMQGLACLVVDGNTFPEFQDNIQGYVSAAAVNYNQVDPPILSFLMGPIDKVPMLQVQHQYYLARDSFPPGSDDTDFDPERDLHLIEELLNNDPSSPLPLSHNPLSGSTTSSSPDHLLEEFTDELALITFPSGNDDLPFDIESDIREI